MDELYILNKKILLAESEILFNSPLTEKIMQEEWETRHSQWVCREGAFWGKNAEPAPGVIFSKKAYPQDVLLDFYAQTVRPSTHDIDVMWNMSWDDAKDQRGPAYVAGLQGWWDNKVGIEKSPDYQLIAAAPSPWFIAGTEYHIQAGGIQGHNFIFVNGDLRLELLDPSPIDARKHNRVGFEAYQSMVKISRLVIRKVKWVPRNQSYKSEF